MMHDEKLCRALIETLAHDPALDATHIGVAVADGVAELGGHVRSPDELLAARRAALRVSGIRIVVDALEIERAQDDDVPDDSDIAHHIVRAFASTVDGWPASDLQAEVRSGVVTLRGTLERQSQRQTLESRVGALAGVRVVSSLIGLASSSGRTPG